MCVCHCLVSMNACVCLYTCLYVVKVSVKLCVLASPVSGQMTPAAGEYFSPALKAQGGGDRDDIRGGLRVDKNQAIRVE